MKKVYISADMEGVSGIVHFAQTGIGEKEYERARNLMADEVNAAIEGALAAGVTEILVNDAHGSMRNILHEKLNPVAQLISGSPKPLSMMQGIDEGCDAAFFIGYHAQAGAMYGVLNHVYSGRVYSVALNGKLVGELGLNAALAGYFGVPVILVTGDEALVAEARSILGDIETVAVKHAYGMRAARCLAPSRVHSLIREAAIRALQKGGTPFVVPPPITLTVSFQQSIHAEMAELVPGSRRVDGRTIEFVHDDMPTLYRTWRAMVGLAGLVDE
ncbi:MAG: M55 family metallopeptidase [Anaerolineae bacterium]